ncbi:UNVERIFIED_CONTAM: hypothetical protein K2H54_069561 [Gekko kuhli]
MLGSGEEIAMKWGVAPILSHHFFTADPPCWKNPPLLLVDSKQEINRRLKRRDVEEVSMASDSASKNIDILMFETLITDALERLSDKVATMIDPINLQLQEINHKLEAIAEETRKAKEMAQHNTEAIAGMERAILLQQEEISRHQDKIIQLETCLREKRLKLRGVAEDLCPSDNLSHTLSEWLTTLLQLETGTKAINLIENAYRVGKQRQKEPRDVIVELNNTSMREKILSLAKKRRTLNLHNSKILVFPDLPAEAMQRRRSLKETTATLHSMDQRYKWALSGRLIVNLQGTTYSAFDENSGLKLIQAIKAIKEPGNRKKRQRRHTSSSEAGGSDPLM